MRLSHKLLFLFLFVLISCKQGEKVQIVVNFTNNKNSMDIELFRQDFDRITPTENLTLKANKQRIIFKLNDVQEPTFYQLHITEELPKTIVFIVEPGERVSLEINMEKIHDYAISGSEESAKVKMLNDRISKTIKTLDSLEKVFSQTQNQHERNILQQNYNETIEKQREYSEQFIWDNPRSRASVMALYQQYGENQFVFDRAEDIRLFKVVGTSLQAMYPESEYTKGMLRDIANQEKKMSNIKLMQLIKDSESSLPEISLPNPQGDTIQLSSLMGKVILLSFWSTASTECLMDNRELLDIYSQYKGRGFEIYQVSLDAHKEPWLAIIQRDALPWISVRAENPDASVVVGQYNVEGIPSNYLIDKSFDIVGKNLFGKELVARLKESL